MCTVYMHVSLPHENSLCSHFLYRDVVMGDLETAESRLDDAYAASEKEKNLRYMYATKFISNVCVYFTLYV